MDPRLGKLLDDVRRQFQRLRYWQSFGIACFAAATFVFGVRWLASQAAFDGFIASDWFQRSRVEAAIAFLAIAGSCMLLASIVASRTQRDPRRIAQRIEQTHPDLNERLLAAVDQHPNENGEYSYLQRRVVEAAIAHQRTSGWSDTVGKSRMRWSKLLAIASSFLLLAGISQWIGNTPGNVVIAEVAEQLRGLEFRVQPGDVEVERGSSLVVTAKFSTDAVPTDVYVVSRKSDVDVRTQMARNLDDPTFGGYLADIDSDMEYRVEAGERTSEFFKIKVFEYPTMLRCDAVISPPSYTSLPPKTIENTIRVTVSEGTLLTWNLYLNKPVAEAMLVAKEGEILKLSTSDQSDEIITIELEMLQSKRWKLKLVDSEGRENKFPPELVVRVQPNRPAELKLVSAGDAVVSPIEELPISAEVKDDYGIRRVGLTYTVGNGESMDVELVGAEGSAVEGSPAKLKTVSHLVDLENARAEADQLLSYHFWAEDLGPDGNVRRTNGDIFFAEVRPFEQIFREGSAPGGESQPQQPSESEMQQAQQAEELAELQKQIVAATWNLIRRADLATDIGSQELKDSLLPDLRTILDSQLAAISQLEQLTENLPPDRSPELVEAVEGYMQAAVLAMSDASENRSRLPLDDAMVGVRAAYQALLRLRAREFEVVQQQQQQQQQQSGSASRSNMQRQLDQLELKNDPNRYEEERTAQPQSQSPVQQAQEILNGLQELARRQTDLNEQMKAAELELQLAETAEERDEIERKLERLREQQQEILRDADELASKLGEQPQDKATTNATEQLEQTRETLRDAEQALEQKQPSEALAAGSRAERSLDELQEEFQRESAAAVAERMKELRDQSNQLAEQQKEIETLFEALDAPPEGPGLRAEKNNRDEIAERLKEQSVQLDELIDNIRVAVTDTEESQPLLAEQLYEAQADAQRDNVSNELSRASEMISRGFDPGAMQASEFAGEKIEALDQRLQRAANSILGDPTEALQRARNELEDLAEQLASERGESAQGDSRGQQAGQQSGSEQAGASPDGEPSDSNQSRSAEGQTGESPQQQGQPGTGQPQQGQPQQQGQPADEQRERGQPGQGEPSQGEPSQGEPSQGEPGQSQPGQSQPGQSQPGQGQPGQAQSGQQSPGNGLASSPSGQNQQGDGGQTDGGGLLDGQWAESFGGEDLARPITGDGFREWSERLRQVENTLPDSELRSQAAGIRDRARELRRDVTRRSESPQWSEIEDMLAEPLRQLRVQVDAELLRRSAERNAVVPMDRDPVPEQFSEAVRKYYEQVGAGR